MILAKYPVSVHATGMPRFIDEYNLPTAKSAPLALTVDRNGIVWFTESNATKLGRFDPSTQTFREYQVPGAGDMWGITTDERGNVWLTQYSLKGSVSPGGAIEPGGNGRLISFNPNDGNFTVVNISTPGGFPFRVATDNQGRVWFTELLGNQIGYYDPASKRLEEYPVPTPFAGPADLTFDMHGTVWFTEAYNESVASFNPSTKNFTEYHFSIIDPTQYVGSPVGISVTPDGLVWVADHGGNWIVEFNYTSGQMVRYPTHQPPPQVYPISIPNGLQIDGQGRVWFSEHGGNSIGFIDPRTQGMVEYAIPTGPISTALWVAISPNGDVWFTEWSANKIGVVHASLPIPFTVTASQNYLNLQTGSSASLSLNLNSSVAVAENGTYVYSWPSYNRGDVNVTFSPTDEILNEVGSFSTQAQIAASMSALPGNYRLGLGFDAGELRVWTMVDVQVSSAPTTTALFGANSFGVQVSVIAAVLILVVVFERRFRGSKKKRAAKR